MPRTDDEVIADFRAKIPTLAENIFNVMAEECDRRRGVTIEELKNQDFNSRMKNAVMKLTPTMLRDGIEAGIKRGDPSMLGKVMVILEQIASREQMGDVVVKLTPYRVKDENIPRIIADCPVFMFDEIVEAVETRKAKVRYIESMDPEVEEDDEESAVEFEEITA